MNRPAIGSILIAGDGIVGLSAGLAFSRALPGVDVRLLRLPADPAALADRCAATLPAVGRFHAAIGFDELDLVRRRIAVHHLGTRFVGGAAGEWIHSFGEVGRGEGAVAFPPIWLSARQAEAALDFGQYSPASVIGGAGKFVHPSGDPTTPLGSYLYGLRLDPGRYRNSLEQATGHLARIEGAIAAIERRPDGAIAALRLADGRRESADLYVDCSGPAAALIGAVGDDFDDWSAWLPARHVASESSAPSLVEPLDRIDAIDQGWRLTATFTDVTLRTSVTSAAVPGAIAIRPGARRAPFVANVLALGDAAVTLDPLHATALSLAHSAILRAIELIPGRDLHPLELAEYNRRTRIETERARDFHMLFQSQLPGVAAPPESLARTLVQWRARARLPFFEEETFSPSSWAQTLIGLGILPQAVAPLARAIDPKAAAAAMAAFARELDELAQRLPPYPDYLERMIRAPR